MKVRRGGLAGFGLFTTVLWVCVLLLNPLSATAHAGAMDYMFNAMKDLFTPIEQVTPAEETKTAIAHPATETPEPARRLVFDIRAADTNEPIGGATCIYWLTVWGKKRADNTMTLTGKNVLEVPAGTTHAAVFISTPQRAAQSVYLSMKSKPAQIDVPVRLEKGIAAGGSVTNEEGQPVEGALVEISAHRGGDGYVLLGRLTTDAGGRWSTTCVPPGVGQIFLWAAHSGYVPSCRVKVRWNDNASARIGEDALLQLVRGVPVAGRVMNSQGAPVAGAQVCLDNDSQEPLRGISAKADDAGWFCLEHCPVREAALVVAAAGCASQEIPLTIIPGMPDTVITLDAERPIRFLLVDPDGSPLANAPVDIVAIRDGTYFYYSPQSSVTDSQGGVTLASAPANADYNVFVDSWGNCQDVKVRDGQEPVRVVVPAESYVVLQAEDASTGRPIRKFDVMRQNEAPAGSPVQSWAWRGSFEDGESRMSLRETTQKVRFRVDAPGYRRGITRWMKPDENGKVAVKLFLVAASMRKGHVLDDQGRPAPGPQVWWLDGPYFDVRDNASREGAAPIQGDDLGVFSITDRDWESGMLLVTAEAGMALVSGLDFGSVSNVHLKPWGRVMCDMPSTPGVEASLSGAAQERSPVWLSYTARIDGKGGGAFNKVYPGNYRVSREVEARIPNGGAVPVGAVSVASGQTAQISVPPGRKVLLHLAVPDEAKPWLDRQTHRLYFSLQSVSGDAGGDFRDTCSLWPYTDVSGRVELGELVPGAYALEAGPLRSPALPLGSPIERYFITDKVRFVVQPPKPGDDAPLDLGTLQMHVEGEDSACP